VEWLVIFTLAADWVDVTSGMSMVLVCRRIQLIEELHAVYPQYPSWEVAGLSMSFTVRRGEALLAPSLRSRVTGKRAAHSAFQKEVRNAMESRKGYGNGKKKDKGEECGGDLPGT
jgi:hypothetical protein